MADEYIQVISGEHTGKRFKIERPFTIGRYKENVLCLDSNDVSRCHAVIEQTPVGTVLRDLGSTNGTYVGERRVLETGLKHGDLIRIGPVELRYETDAPAPQDEELPAADYQYVDKEITHSRMIVQPVAEVAVRKWDLLAKVYGATQTFHAERDIKRLMRKIAEQTVQLLAADSAAILMRHERTGQLTPECISRSEEHARNGARKPKLPLDRSVMDRAVERCEAVITHEVRSEGSNRGRAEQRGHVTSILCVPLMDGNIIGAIYAVRADDAPSFAKDDLDIALALASPAAAAIRTAELLSSSYEETLVALANAIELRDHYTVGHGARVTQFALEIARELGWSNEKLAECRMGGILHDIGKIAVDDAILRKAGLLEPEEWEKMRLHPEHGAHTLQDVPSLNVVLPYVLYHHVRYDGVTDGPNPGYPAVDMAGDEIPVEGRLLNVADGFDALTSSRSYKHTLKPDEAIAVLQKDRGTRADPMCVDALTRCYQAGKLNRIVQESLRNEKRTIACPFCSTYINIPANAALGIEWNCGICHRQISLSIEGDSYIGLLVSRLVMPKR